MDLNEILFNLNDDNPEQIKTLRKIITLSCCGAQNWIPLASKLKDLIKQNQLVGKESALLASQALFSLYTNFDNDNTSTHLRALLSSLDETCKLTVTFGYLQTKPKTPIPNEIFILLFDIIKAHCTTYTRHTYFAEKVLCQWLETSIKTQFWKNNSEMEKSLEAIIFSNWQNSIQDVAKCNSSRVFRLYLKIMQDNYKGHVEFLLQKCVYELTWNHVIKYKILTEVCSSIADGCELSPDVRRCLMEKLLDSVTVCHLQKASSHVYEILLIKKAVRFDEFVTILEHRVQRWNEENNDEAVFYAYKYVIQKIFQSSETSIKQLMLNEMSPKDNFLYNSYIQLLRYESKRYDEPIRAKIRQDWLKSDYQKAAHLSLVTKSNLEESVIIEHVISVVSSMANTESVYLRTELIRNMDILFSRVSKLGDNLSKKLHDFFNHCFDVATTYQRKILGLAVYKNARRRGSDFLTLDHDEEMRNRLFRLVLDPASDVRSLATDLLVNHFRDRSLTTSEVELLKEKARGRSNSLNFYEAETAAILIRLLYEWKAIDEDLQFWIREARQQFMEVKSDICKAVRNNKPFYGILIVILENFHGAFRCSDEITFGQILDLLEDAVQFFTETLLKPVESSEYASTVAGIGVAVQEIVQNRNTESDLSISLEHQNIFTCIWRSLKATSEIAAAIAIKSEDDENIDRSCHIILNILLKCYHKGAIKSAGLSLSRVCRHFCETNKITSKKNSFESQLKRLCNLEKSNDEEAGLTIAFHRIVASDVRPARPFVHHAMETLLKFLEEKLKAMNLSSNEERALPCVLQLNFLQTLIEDKQLLSAITIYLEDVCFVCLQFMQANDFLIRNAGMQLYGAIIPRLTGQIADVNSDFGYGYSVGHFVSHYPRLSEHVLQTLESCSRLAQTRTINLESYSNLSNIMILLSKLFVGGCDVADHPAEGYVDRVTSAVQYLLRCHVAYVRLLAAKVYVAFTGLPKMVPELVRLAQLLPRLNDENELHGFLLAFTYLSKKVKHEKTSLEMNFEPVQLVRFWSRRCHQLSLLKRPCFVVETLLLKNPEILYILGYLQNIGSQNITTKELTGLLLSEKFASFAGFQEFVTELMKMYCSHDSWSDLEFVELILSSPNHDYGVAFLKFARVSTLDEIVEKLNRLIGSIYRQIGTDCGKSVSLYDVLQAAVVKTIAEYKLFDRAWKYGCMKKEKWFTGIGFSEADERRLIEDSVVVKLFHQVFRKFLSLGYNGYRKLCDFDRKLYADFMYVGYNHARDKNLDFELYPYVLMISRDEAPDVRDTFKDVTECFMLKRNDQNKLLCCPQLKVEIMRNMKNVSKEEFWARCKLFLQLVEREIYENCRDDNVVTCYHDDVRLLSFVNHLIDNRHDLCSDTNILQCTTLRDAKYFRSLRDSIDMTDSIYVLQVHDYVSNKLTEARTKELG